MTQTPCPVIQDQKQVTRHARNLARSMRKLNADKQLCEDCKANPFCSTAQTLNQTIQAAIEAVNSEWESLQQGE